MGLIALTYYFEEDTVQSITGRKIGLGYYRILKLYVSFYAKFLLSKFSFHLLVKAVNLSDI